ncbi:MAG: pyruvate carboxylase subunit B [bacterium]|nr:pyruvate carboxylase subunit B [bacterium]
MPRAAIKSNNPKTRAKTPKRHPVRITELVLRDAHQSLLATRMKTVDMLPICERLDKVGYWSLEVWGGATFDTCLRYLGEDPWQRLRQLKRALPRTPLQMLFRGQNILGYRHYADDVVERFVDKSIEYGMNVFRIFDALNDLRNIETAVRRVIKGGQHAQGAICYTVSPVHTLEIFVDMARRIEDMGCHSLVIKDMAALLLPMPAFELVTAIKAAVMIPVHVHTHSTTGVSPMVLMKAIEAGADGVDTAISSLSLGSGHVPTESLVESFRSTLFDTGLDQDNLLPIADYIRGIRPKYKEFETSFSGADTRIFTSQIPGGMISNMESQLRNLGCLDRLDEVMEEVPKVRADMGYIPLVTPTSQIVGTQAVMNVLMGGRYKSVSEESRNVFSGHYGATPAPVDAAIQKQILGDEAPIACRPADLIPNEWDRLKTEVDGKARGDDDVLSYAVFPKVWLDYYEKHIKAPATGGDGKTESPPVAGTPVRFASEAAAGRWSSLALHSSRRWKCWKPDPARRLQILLSPPCHRRGSNRTAALFVSCPSTISLTITKMRMGPTSGRIWRDRPTSSLVCMGQSRANTPRRHRAMPSLPISRRNFLKSAGALAGAVALGGRAEAEAPPAPLPARRPNILVILSDQQHWRALGCMDPFFTTPHLDALAREAAVFESNFCTTPQCSPSRATLMTGLMPHRTGIVINVGNSTNADPEPHAPPCRRPNIGSMLRAAGYHTAYFGKWHLDWPVEAATGWNECRLNRITDAQTTSAAVDFLARRTAATEPFALFLSYVNPHDIYEFDALRAGGPGDARRLPPGDGITLPRSFNEENFARKPAAQKAFMTEDQGRPSWGGDQADWQSYRALYREKVRLYDAQAGRVLGKLREIGALEHTIVIATADHGDMDTHHRLIYKGPFMYDQLVRVPMIVRVPGQYGGQGGRRVAEATSNADLVATLRDFAGLNPDTSDGLSWKPFLTGSGLVPPREFVISQYYGKQRWFNPIRMLRTARYKYNCYLGAGEEFYDLREDPDELINRAGDGGYAAPLGELQAALRDWMRRNDDPFLTYYRTTRDGRVIPDGRGWTGAAKG